MMLLWINLYAGSGEEGIPYKAGLVEDEHFEVVHQKYKDYLLLKAPTAKVEYTPYEGKYANSRVRRADKNQSWRDAFKNNALVEVLVPTNTDWDAGTVYIFKLPEVLHQYKYHYYLGADYASDTGALRGVSLTPCLPASEVEIDRNRVISADTYGEAITNGLRISSSERSGSRF